MCLWTSLQEGGRGSPGEQCSGSRLTFCGDLGSRAAALGSLSPAAGRGPYWTPLGAVVRIVEDGAWHRVNAKEA